MQRSILVTRMLTLYNFPLASWTERVLLKLPVLPGLTAKAAVLCTLWWCVTLLLATALDTRPVVLLILIGHEHGNLNLVRTVRTLVPPLFILLSIDITLLTGPPVPLAYLMTPFI